MRELTKPPDQILRGCSRWTAQPGTANPADAFTKHLTKPAFKPYACKIYFYNVHADHF